MLKIINLVFDIDSSEIFLNVFKIYNDNEKGSGSVLIKKILNKDNSYIYTGSSFVP